MKKLLYIFLFVIISCSKEEKATTNPTKNPTTNIIGKKFDDFDNSNDFTLQGNKWDKSNLTFAFDFGFNSSQNSDQMNAIRSAINTWDIAIASFTISEIQNPNQADMVFGFGGITHGNCPHSFSSNALAHGFFPPPNAGTLAGDVHINNTFDWSTNNSPNTFDFETICLHEIGHAMGLKHSNDVNSVMTPNYAGTRRSLTQDDINGICQLYICNNSTQKQILLNGDLSFGSINIGSYLEKTLTISNTGNSTLSITNISVPNGFSVVNSQPFNLEAGKSQDITIRFQPQNAISYSGNVTVTSNATSGTSTLGLSGTGNQVVNNTRIIQLTGDLNFGIVNIGSSSERTLIISNTGNSTLDVSNISVPNGFSIVNSQPSNIGAGQSQNFTVRFQPQNASYYSGNITVSSNATSGNNLINLSGTGVSNTPQYSISPPLNTYTAEATSDFYETCSSYPFRHLSQFQITVASITSTTIYFNIRRSLASFAGAGNAYIKDGNACGKTLNQQSFPSREFIIILSIPNNLLINQTKTYTGVISFDGYDPDKYKYYTLPITITRTQ